jgi:hypothetical protein
MLKLCSTVFCAAALLAACSQPDYGYVRPQFYAVDMVRDANGNGRGEAARAMANATCDQTLDANATDHLMRVAAMGLGVGPHDHDIYVDNHFPTCMQSLGFQTFTDRAEAKAVQNHYAGTVAKGL